MVIVKIFTNYLQQPMYILKALKRNRSARWGLLNILRIIAENEGNEKSTIDCSMIQVKEFCFLRLNLDPEHRSDKYLRLKSINACRNVQACQHTCFKSEPLRYRDTLNLVVSFKSDKFIS